MSARWRRAYGSSPLHLLAQALAFAVTAYAVTRVTAVASTQDVNLVLWFVLGALLHDMVLVPAYLILDLVVRVVLRDHDLLRVRAINHVRFPAAFAGVSFLTLFPLVLGKGDANYARTSGEQAPDYLSRWLLVCALAFALSAVIFVLRRMRNAA